MSSIEWDARSIRKAGRRGPAYRLLGFAFLNAAVAAGVAIGFHPHPIR